MKKNVFDLEEINLKELESILGGESSFDGCCVTNGKCSKGGCGVCNGQCGELVPKDDPKEPTKPIDPEVPDPGEDPQ
ncbi:MAG: hypothetical protein ACI3YS_08955 [Prevotella sp.]